MMKHIALTRGKYTLVDDCDYKCLMQWQWYFNGYYAVRTSPRRARGQSKTIYLHRVVAERAGLDVQSRRIDHRNRNGLDNRRRNLREASVAQNRANGRPRQGSVSGCKGVYWDKDNRKWRARISVGHHCHSLGRSITKREAALAYNQAALEYFGDFAWLNTWPCR